MQRRAITVFAIVAGLTGCAASSGAKGTWARLVVRDSGNLELWLTPEEPVRDSSRCRALSPDAVARVDGKPARLVDVGGPWRDDARPHGTAWIPPACRPARFSCEGCADMPASSIEVIDRAQRIHLEVALQRQGG